MKADPNRSLAPPNDMKAKQAVKLRSAIGKILRAAKNKGQLSKEFPYEVLLDITLGIFTSTLTHWAMQDGFPLVSKVRQAVKFIQHTILEVDE